MKRLMVSTRGCRGDKDDLMCWLSSGWVKEKRMKKMK